MVGSPEFPLFILFRDVPLKSSVFLGGCMVHDVISLQEKSELRKRAKEHSEFSEGSQGSFWQDYGNQEPTELSGLSEANGYQEKEGGTLESGVSGCSGLTVEEEMSRGHPFCFCLNVWQPLRKRLGANLLDSPSLIRKQRSSVELIFMLSSQSPLRGTGTLSTVYMGLDMAFL